MPKLKLLARVGRADAARLLRTARPRELAPREVYIEYGSALPGFCFVVSGSLILWLGRGRARRVFRVVAKGDSFCEAPALVRAPSPFEVRAQGRSQVLAVPVHAIERLARRSRTFSDALIALLAERAMLAIGDLDASTVSAAERICAYLASIAQLAPSGEWQASLPVTKSVLAARLGITKETLSRALRSLADSGLITARKRNFTIGEPKAWLAAARSQLDPKPH